MQYNRTNTVQYTTSYTVDVTALLNIYNRLSFSPIIVIAITAAVLFVWLFTPSRRRSDNIGGPVRSIQLRSFSVEGAADIWLHQQSTDGADQSRHPELGAAAILPCRPTEQARIGAHIGVEYGSVQPN